MSDSDVPTDSPALPPKAGSSPRLPVSAATAGEPAGWRKIAGLILSVLIVAGAVVLILMVWGVVERHPRTDDAILRANVVGIAPRVRGQIIRLNVQDNQEVKEGDVLFEIDPDDYRLALERAKSSLAALDQQIEVARAQDTELKFKIKAAEARPGEQRGRNLNKRKTRSGACCRCCPKGSPPPRTWTKRRPPKRSLSPTSRRRNRHSAKRRRRSAPWQPSARSGPARSRRWTRRHWSFRTAKSSLRFLARSSASTCLPAHTPASALPCSHCSTPGIGTSSPTTAKARSVILVPGALVDVYLLSAPDRHFTGKVQGIGWAVEPSEEQGFVLPGQIPHIKRELNWVHIAQRFPVRIEVEHPDPDIVPNGCFRRGHRQVRAVSLAAMSAW